jgi:HJR/Mrr/RecB family endonuclease
MARHRKDDGITAILQLGGLIALLYFIYAPARQIIFAIGSLFVALLSLLVVAAGGLVVYRGMTRSSRTVRLSANVLTPVCETPRPMLAVQTSTTTPTKTTFAGSAEIIRHLRSVDWFQFEKLVELLYQKLGYQVTRRGGANPDGGIDLLITKDGLTSAIQCKQWRQWKVGVKAVREFLGALTDSGIQKGIFITLSGYTGDAKQLAQKHGISILNESELAKMLEDIDGRFDPQVLALLQDKRKFCPKCEKQMVLRTTKKGPWLGQQFWGCPAYPKCRGKIPVRTGLSNKTPLNEKDGST